MTLRERLEDVQAKARQARVAAFVDYEPTVAGERLNPITLGTYNALVAFENGFATGGPVSVSDVIAFVWLHSPGFGQFETKRKARVARRVLRALHPRFPMLNALLLIVSEFPRWRFLRRFCVPTAEERIAEAVEEIRRLIKEAIHDIPTRDGDGEPPPVSFTAHVLGVFRRDLGISFEETMRMPMRRVAQHYREALHTASGGKALMLTPEEAEIWAEHLKARAEVATAGK